MSHNGHTLCQMDGVIKQIRRELLNIDNKVGEIQKIVKQVDSMKGKILDYKNKQINIIDTGFTDIFKTLEK